MNARFPQRPAAHQLEEASRRFFVHSLPRNWTSDRPGDDYGVDLRVDMFEGDAATGLELLVQLKASARETAGDVASFRLGVGTFNMLRAKLQVAMLVKYYQADNEAYWLLLREVPEPRAGLQTFTVAIPKANRLSQIDWRLVQDHVRNVTDLKLAAMRRHELQNRRR